MCRRETGLEVFRRARNAMKVGAYGAAVRWYCEGQKLYPRLASLYRANIEVAKHRLNAHVHVPKEEEKCLPEPQPPKAEGSSAADFPTLDELYRRVRKDVKHLESEAPVGDELVSVIMTTHNSGDYVDAAVTSILRQTWKNLELVIVDDASEDRTWSTLERLSRVDKRVRIIPMNTNLGTYFAKNYGISRCNGQYVFFQDSDDLSHPERIRVSMHYLRKPGVIAVRGGQSRVLYPERRVLPVNGKLTRPGYITLGLRRSVFARLGVFNATVKASDAELIDRLEILAAHEGSKIASVKSPLYYLTFRTNSLSADMIQNDVLVEGFIRRQDSVERQMYRAAFTAAHERVGVERFPECFRFPVLRDIIPVQTQMSRLPNPEMPVVAAMCSIPERVSALYRTLKSIQGQVDKLYLYLDGHVEVPTFVSDLHPNCVVLRSGEFPGLRDNGKFFAWTLEERECFCLTMDDDIEYPPEYVAAMIRSIEEYGRQAIVGVHGILVGEYPEGYFRDYRKVHIYKQTLERDTGVNILGTGTVAFHSSIMHRLTMDDFDEAGMADIHLGVYAKRLGIPMVAVRRPERWLVDQPVDSPNLYHEFKSADEAQARKIRAAAPWGVRAVKDAVEAVLTEVDERCSLYKRLRGLVPELTAYMR